MIAAVVNSLTVVLDALIGSFFGGRPQERHTATIVKALSLVVLVLGISSAIKTENLLAVIVCLLLGTIAGETLGLERRLNSLGGWLRKRFAGGKAAGNFTEGFVICSLLVCVGSMAIIGSMEAGIHHNYATIYSKSVIDGVMAVTFAINYGIGAAFAALPLLVYQGGLTLLASAVAPYLSNAVVTEMSAVGGILLIGTGINMLELTKERIRVGNMLPAVFLPVLYLPLAHWMISRF